MKKKRLFVILMIAAVFLLSGCDSLGGQKELTNQEAQDKMQGFWIFAGYDGQLSEGAKDTGIAMEIDGDEMDIYTEFELKSMNAKMKIKDGDKLEYYEQGESIKVDLSFETRDGYELMIFETDEGEAQFEKISTDAFELYKELYTKGEDDYSVSISLAEELYDSQLAWYISNTEWTELHYLYPDGTTEEMSSFTMVMNTEGRSGTLYYTDETIYATWEVEDGKLYLTYEDGGVFYFPIDYMYDADTKYAYLHLYDTEEGYEGCAWVLWDIIE